MSTYPGPERRKAPTRDARVEILIKVLVAQIFFAILLIGTLWWSGYSDRQDTVQNQRGGCERGKLDRRANASGWRTAEAARRATAEDPNVTADERRNARIAADRYQEIADALDERSRLDCEKAFPDASLLEFANTAPDAEQTERQHVAERRLDQLLAVASAEVQRERVADAALGRSSDDP